MDRRALDHALEGGRGHGFRSFDIGDQRRQKIKKKNNEILAQLGQVDIAGAHDADCIGFFGQRQQQMFQRRQFMAAFICKRERGMDGLFQRGRE